MEGFKSHMKGKGYSWMFDAEDAEDDDDRRPLMEELEIDPASVPFFSFFPFCHARCWECLECGGERPSEMQLQRGEVVASAACGAACGAAAVLWLLWPQRDRPARQSPPTSLEGIIEYHQLWVRADGSTSVAQGLSFSGLERKGYSGTPQYVREFGPSDFVVKRTLVTQMTGDNPWHYAPSAQFVVVLSGAWFVKGTDGRTTVFRPGDVLYQDNTKAHPAAKDGTQQAMHFSGVAPGETICSQLIIQVERSASVNNPGEWGGIR